MDILFEFIVNNFWLLLLVITFLICKHYRIGGILILMILIFTDGTIPYWILGIIVILTVFTLYLKPYNFYKNRYNKKVDQFYKQVQLKEKRKRFEQRTATVDHMVDQMIEEGNQDQ